ncbi:MULTISPECIES: Bax inhibitor-1/YccA family protein [unclassified Crossiella]|uniref:Bax inhibitor-1/YccA family protein n=1 Tax=unclassified Crossiella TaxID=2620835 RepID=UPI001FFFCE3F|nr:MULTISPECIES: Bax inhibitor-1/YccA family protein [unclassified Crossiella]MCK2237080.1 Bax inhibitor-1/YccA family protein [Crossiella sp. S99.2]MCK2250748.1 Bax inhibitor-1/YccA family protein [Crossiella sp. S99.1]
MRTSSNPAFRNLPHQGSGYATFNTGGQPAGYQAGYQQQPGYQQYDSRPGISERPMTVDDVVMKTATSFGVTLVAGFLTAFFQAYYLALPAVLIGLGVGLFLSFRPRPSAPLTLTYALSQGVALGAISALVNLRFPGIVVQALIGTAGVFAGMLVVYKTGAIRVTPKLTRWVIGALVGVLVLVLANLVASFIVPGGLGLRSGGAIAIIFSIIVIGVAAFALLLDFDQADEMIRSGMDAKWAWYAAFGLTATVVMLYLEILRLLSYFRQD